MSLRILNAHTGQRLSTDPSAFVSLDALKAWIAQTTSVTPSQQILLTAAGKQAKYPAFIGETEVFLYNRQFISSVSNSSTRPIITPASNPFVPSIGPPPDVITDQNDLDAWRSLFEARQDWASNILSSSRSLAQTADEHFDAITIVERGVGVAIGNLQSHVKTLEQKYGEACAWSQQAVEEQERILASYGITASFLSSLPAKKDFIRFLPKLQMIDGNAIQESSNSDTTLAFFDNQDAGYHARAAIQQATRWMVDRTSQMGIAVKQVVKDARELVAEVDQAQAQTLRVGSRDASQLMEEIEVIAKKIGSDYEHVVGLLPGAKSVSQASKMALLHTRSHLPSLTEIYQEVLEVVHQAVIQRNAAASIALTHMQRIAIIESAFAQVNSQVLTLDMPKAGAEAFDVISLLSQLPLVYGTLLIEAVRRREWSDKLKNESAVLAEDIAGYREEEERRRKKWFRKVGDLVSEEASTGTALNFELNLQPGEHEWPEVTREDVTEYLDALRRSRGVEHVVEELSEAVKDLERPSRRQLKKAKGFKMGSIHEAESNKGSFLLRNDDELRMMKDVNQKLEEELKSQRSRVRKLEDLVYKHGQNVRTTSGKIFQVSDGQRPVSPGSLQEPASSPIPSPKGNDLLSRKASVNSRRTSTNNSADEKALARRIVTLEAELHDERRRGLDHGNMTDLTPNVEARMTKELGEVYATNKDLMANMEAQQREFSNERRSLNEELDKYKLKADEFEDELDRLSGSRDNEKLGFDEKVRSLELELERTNQVLSGLQAELREKDEVQEDQSRTLRIIHSNLGPDRAVPRNLAELIHGLDELAERSARHVKDISQALASAKVDNEELQSFLTRIEDDSATTRCQVESLEDEAAGLRSETASQKARAESLAIELEDGRNQLRTLRAKFAEGETGSEALRQRLEEQAAKASTLATQLAEAKSQINSLDLEIMKVQHKQHKVENEAMTSSKRLEHRSARDRELTHRIATYNNELTRLLDALGLSIIERDGTMAIQRTSKLSGTSTTLTDPSTSSTPPLVMGQPLDISIDSTLLQWMQADSAEKESQLFKEFLAQADLFNLNKFSEAIIKLRRDVEWTGKKWKAEARSYRDRFHRVQNEAHDKIAFRSFREGDLALFLPTRNQATRPWAAFNVGAPHYFLREQDSHKLQNREWLVARISKVQERVVDLSKTMDAVRGSDGRSIGETSESGISSEDDNPFELSDGLRWYLLDAAEEKAGAPSTPGLGKTTVASANVDVKGSIRMKKSPAGYDASTKLNKSLESRRSSSTSKRGSISGIPGKDGVLEVGTGAFGGVDVSRSSSMMHLRPGSQSSIAAPAGPSGLGIEIAKHTDEHVVAKELSPSKRLLGLFGATSPPKPPWVGQAASDGSPSKIVLTRPLPTPMESQGPSIGKQQSPQKRSVRSSSSSPTKGKQTAWESLWSLDMSIEGGKAKD